MDTETLTDDLKSRARSVNPRRREGKIAKAIESQTSRIPSDAFLWAAGGVMTTSLTLKFLKMDHLALFIGQWAAPLLLFGIYNKMVKQKGHDQEDPQPA
ncbi:MAG TPA: hypothetical protein VFE50_18875 [Cyclobacteriaceae bacterium]|nr:hypothetical protein [Cyclobacteriaceae bacterium]